MNVNQIEKFFLDTSYVRMGGRPEELKCAEYLLEKCVEIQQKCEETGVAARAELVSFEVDLADIKEYLKYRFRSSKKRLNIQRNLTKVLYSPECARWHCHRKRTNGTAAAY